MANQKPKKSGKKAAPQPETKKEIKESVSTEETMVVSHSVASDDTKKSTKDGSMKGFFARKYPKDENILTIFKTPRIWGALLGEMIGTLLISMLLLTMGLQPLYLACAIIGIYAVIVGLSGANLNPLITVGMMASRRMSAIRGVLYILAQLLGAWVGLIIVNAFRLGSGTSIELLSMAEITGDAFWAVALVELLGAIVLAFCFARVLRYARKSPLTFAWTMASALLLVTILGIVIAQNYFRIESAYIFNPVIALMYQILPSAAENVGELFQVGGLALAAYVVMPIIGGVIGFYISDVASRLSCGGYFCDYDEENISLK